MDKRHLSCPKGYTALNSLTGQEKEAAKKYGFTLVELIVVITILAILGTIAFISLQGYSQDARDSVRVSDISKIKTSLELFQLDAGKYPETTDSFSVTYSGAVAWIQGIFGETTYNNVEKLDKIPIDPVSARKYVYSVTNTKQEYQIAGVMEGDEVTAFFNQTNATQKTAMLKISGNYNGKLLKVSTGGIDYVLAVPSIITSSGFTLEQIVSGKLLAYNGYKNLPAQYAGSSYEVLGDSGINFVNNANLVVYSGSLSTLSDSTSIGIDARKNLIVKLQSAYSGTSITNVGEIAQIITINSEDSKAVELLSNNIVNNDLGGNIVINIQKDWRDFDPNCDIPDIKIGNQTWAGCNSTLGNGVEFGKKDDGTNGTIGSCYKSYSGIPNIISNCLIDSIAMSSNTKANLWFTGINVNGDSEVANIWGKYYTWANSKSACAIGYHVPTDIEWETLETTLNGGVNCRNITNGWICDGLGRKFNNAKNTSNNIVKALKLPLSGIRDIDGSTFYDRGYYTFLFSSTEANSTIVRIRTLSWNNSTVLRFSRDKSYGFSVRCIKD